MAGFSLWYARGDSNPYPCGMEPKSIAYTNFATGAYPFFAVRMISQAHGTVKSILS